MAVRAGGKRKENLSLSFTFDYLNWKPVTRALVSPTDALCTLRSQYPQLKFSRVEDKSKRACKFRGELFIWHLLEHSTVSGTRKSRWRSSGFTSWHCQSYWEPAAPTKCSQPPLPIPPQPPPALRSHFPGPKRCSCLRSPFDTFRRFQLSPFLLEVSLEMSQ